MTATTVGTALGEEMPRWRVERSCAVSSMGCEPYRRIARFYDAIFKPFLGDLRRDVLHFARPRRGMSVLEVGFGTGSNLALCHVVTSRTLL